MSRYHTSSYDPAHYERLGAPLRPYNGWQWLGLALALTGLAVELVYVAGRLGWIAPLLDRPTAAFGLVLGGAALINSRRRPADPAPELAAARKRWLLVICLVWAAVIGVAAAITFSGA